MDPDTQSPAPTLGEKISKGSFRLGASVIASIERDPQGTDGMLWACIEQGDELLGEALLPDSLTVAEVEGLLRSSRLWDEIVRLGGEDLR